MLLGRGHCSFCCRCADSSPSLLFPWLLLCLCLRAHASGILRVALQICSHPFSRAACCMCVLLTHYTHAEQPQILQPQTDTDIDTEQQQQQQIQIRILASFEMTLARLASEATAQEIKTHKSCALISLPHTHTHVSLGACPRGSPGRRWLNTLTELNLSWGTSKQQQIYRVFFNIISEAACNMWLDTR